MTRTIVITGASDGIGAVAAKNLKALGDQVVIVGRSESKTRAVAREIDADQFYVADYENFDDVRALAEKLRQNCDRIDVLANNAGGLFSGPTRTRDGFEKTFQVNHLAPTLLTHLLIDVLVDSQALIVNTSSVGAARFGNIDLNDLNNWNNYRPNKAYGDAKLAGTLFAKGLHERFHAGGLSAISFHPGIVATNFASDTNSFMRWVYQTWLQRFLTTSAEGGATMTQFLASGNDPKWTSGEYYDPNGKIARTHEQAYDPEIVSQHWALTAEMLDINW